MTVLVHEMADDLDAYLASRPGTGPTSIAAVVAFNAAHADEELAHYGQEYLEAAVASGGRAAPEYAAGPRPQPRVGGRCRAHPGLRATASMR